MPHIHVAAAVIRDERGRVLISKRPDHVHQGGLWEFPGGKVEADEEVRQALARELEEELGIRLSAARPLIRISHAYPDRRVLLDVWQVNAFEGEPHGRQGQPLSWVNPAALPAYDFPAANLPIIAAARLPPLYLVTPEPGEPSQWPDFIARLETCLAAGVQLVQLRAKQVSAEQYAKLACLVVKTCRKYDVRLLLNAEPELVDEIGADGLHLTGRRLAVLPGRPLTGGKWVAASCHDETELERAAALKVDFVVLSPVMATASHPGSPTLGWDSFQRLTELSPLPVYALGGMAPGDMKKAWRSGAQGIALSSGIWKAAEPQWAIKEVLSLKY